MQPCFTPMSRNHNAWSSLEILRKQLCLVGCVVVLDSFTCFSLLQSHAVMPYSIYYQMLILQRFVNPIYLLVWLCVDDALKLLVMNCIWQYRINLRPRFARNTMVTPFLQGSHTVQWEHTFFIFFVSIIGLLTSLLSSIFSPAVCLVFQRRTTSTCWLAAWGCPCVRPCWSTTRATTAVPWSSCSPYATAWWR